LQSQPTPTGVPPAAPRNAPGSCQETLAIGLDALSTSWLRHGPGAVRLGRATSPYQGLWSRGIKTYLRQRTLEEYLDAFIAAGLRLVKLADSRDHCFLPGPASILPPEGRFPRFLLLAFTKP
jgi:hypothetical protein